MQTFVTHLGYGRTARALDDRRLGRQRLEALQVFNQLTLGEGDQPNHPVNRMWEGYEFALGIYTMMLCMEWTMHRGCADRIFWEVSRALQDMKKDDPEFRFETPPWHGDKDLMRSHRSNLIRKQAEGSVTGRDYKKLFKGTPLLMPYLWPVIDEDEEYGYKLMVSKADKALLKSKERKLPADIAERVANL